MRRPIVAAVTRVPLFVAAAIAAEKKIDRCRRPARRGWTRHDNGHEGRLYGDV